MQFFNVFEVFDRINCIIAPSMLELLFIHDILKIYLLSTNDKYRITPHINSITDRYIYSYQTASRTVFTNMFSHWSHSDSVDNTNI